MGCNNIRENHHYLLPTKKKDANIFKKNRSINLKGKLGFACYLRLISVKNVK